MTAAPDWPPEYDPGLEPDEDGVFADAAAEMDQWWTEQEEQENGDDIPA